MNSNTNQKDTRRRPQRARKEQSEFEQYIVDISRVTRVMAGGKRMRFRACVVIGDKKGRVGMGLAKAKDVPMAVQKAVKKAERDMIRVPLVGETIPHEVALKDGSARILIKPAPAGTGIISGGAVRIVLEYAGVKNVVSKILGANNKVNNVRATIKALSLLKKPARKAAPATA
ncbi:MAG: 30S ribosomal protein S5 [Candidatus Buchananbacteria bacterium]|nr:30S ribosomal protein S5 [Candidatus Buchananbacteria bacterium]